jgi:hypothetical protein
MGIKIYPDFYPHAAYEQEYFESLFFVFLSPD